MCQLNVRSICIIYLHLSGLFLCTQHTGYLKYQKQWRYFEPFQNPDLRLNPWGASICFVSEETWHAIRNACPIIIFDNRWKKPPNQRGLPVESSFNASWAVYSLGWIIHQIGEGQVTPDSLSGMVEGRGSLSGMIEGQGTLGSLSGMIEGQGTLGSLALMIKGPGYPR